MVNKLAVLASALLLSVAAYTQSAQRFTEKRFAAAQEVVGTQVLEHDYTRDNSACRTFTYSTNSGVSVFAKVDVIDSDYNGVFEYGEDDITLEYYALDSDGFAIDSTARTYSTNFASWWHPELATVAGVEGFYNDGPDVFYKGQEARKQAFPLFLELQEEITK